VIDADFVGEAQVVDRLRSLPDMVRSRLVPAISKLGIDLQSRVRQHQLGGPMRSDARWSSIDLLIEQSINGVSASVCVNRKYVRREERLQLGSDSVRASVRRIKKLFRRTVAERAMGARAYRRGSDPGARSFLHSILEDMTPEIGNEIEASLREAVR
jgi:hypothetical protein